MATAALAGGFGDEAISLFEERKGNACHETALSYVTSNTACHWREVSNEIWARYWPTR